MAKREIVAPKSSMSHTFRLACQQNPDASLGDLLKTIAAGENMSVIDLLDRIADVRIQDMRSLKDPDFGDPSISGELEKMIERVTSFLKEAKEAAGDGWGGRTKAEIKEAIGPIDELEGFALEEAFRRMESAGMLNSLGGERRGVKFELVER